jgi:cell wall-associated NlpC family hydrolase
MAVDPANFPDLSRGESGVVLYPVGRFSIRNAKQRLAALTIGIAVAALAALATTAPALGTPSQIQEKQAEADRVLGEIQALDMSLEKAVEAYDGATVRLEALQSDIKQNLHRLEIAKRSYRRAQRNLQQRIVALYTNGDESTLEVILGATSLDDLLNRLDSAKRISQQDVQIIQAVRTSRAQIAVRERKLEHARAEQRKVVAERRARKESIESQLGERQQLLSSIKDEIDRLKREEAARQRRLREEARRRAEATRAAQSVVDIPAGISTPQGIGTVPPSAYGNSVVSAAMSQLGVAYVWGGSSPSGFDCSGLVVWAFAQAGHPGLPHYTGSLWQMGVAVAYSQLAPGDLVFFYGGSHVGIYIGGGQFVHAPHTGDVVKISDMSPGSSYYYSFLGARRIA